MTLEDFVKDVAINLDRNNVDIYKQQATALTMNVDDLNGEELASMIQPIRSYDIVLDKIFQGDEKKLKVAVTKIMQETNGTLTLAKEVYLKDPKLFKIFNYESKLVILNPENIAIKDMTDEVFNTWLDLPSNSMYKITNTSNNFRFLIYAEDKKKITTAINHKNFKRVASHYPLFKLIVDNSTLLTQQTFDKVLTRIMEIIKAGTNWNTNFSKELSPLGNSPYLQVKHFELFTDVQAEAIIEVAKNNNTLDTAILTYLYARTGDDKFLSPTVKEIFIF